jgi:D-glycero-alpha-D-manno-heptose-7-phosphate kinase
MIISRTPLRISFFGGGTDYPVWYREHGGAVISATINKYSYINVRKLPPFFGYKNRIRYYLNEETQTISEIQHPSVRECARYLNIHNGLEIVHSADLPAQSGLGSSSTFTVGMLHAFHALQNHMPTKRELALEAVYIEQEKIGEAVGSQDQAAAAFGGLNLIRFGSGQGLEVDPIAISRERLNLLQDNLLLVFTGFSRVAADLAKIQISVTNKKTKELQNIMNLSHHALSILNNPNESVDEFGKLLSNHWSIKRGLTKQISNPKIDEIYEIGLKNGALGGKLLGAGGGGFMLFYARKEMHPVIQSALGASMFVPFRFEFTGSKIVYFSHD